MSADPLFDAVSPRAQPCRVLTGTFDGRRRVLVVEDDPVQALLLTLLLDRLNVSSNLVRNGAQAVEAVATEQYAVVLMDYLMPSVDGVEATRQIRLQEQAQGLTRVPIVAVTASAMADECRLYLTAGMDDILLKPFTAQQLEAVLLRHALPLDTLPRCPPTGPEAGSPTWSPNP